jgi:DNA primase catalytic core
MTKRELKLRRRTWDSSLLLLHWLVLGLSTPSCAFVRPGLPPRFLNRIPDTAHSNYWPNSLIAYSSTKDNESNEPEKKVDGAQSGGKYFISSEQLDQLKDSVDIVSVVESYGLPSFSRKSDHSAQAICPFHDDHSPSMSIDNNRKIFKCFACGEGGDVFKFVRSYSALKGEDMAFYESVRYVANKWGDPNINIATFSSKSFPRESEEERKAREEKKKRLLLCNAAAADFYGKALVGLATAGQARTHLRSRGFSPATVRTFALGYAPDAYFQPNQPWGQGSLVNHLRSAGFLAEEITEAGLATETKRPNWKDITEYPSDVTEKAVDKFECLMDRFRGRIIVPIFDESGNNVIAFGGRILPVIGNVTTDFKPPKYLNSPETPVFSKKLELFGLNNAKNAIEDLKKRSDEAGQSIRGSVVVVEGYMDTIALWEAGVHEVVACMGTALTIEQLDKAAKAAGTMGGRVIICLDNDDAGINAVERLCNSLFLAKTCEKHVVEVVVATLPDGIKDPGEYFESKIGDCDAFRSDVLQCATEWSKWYTQKILSRYDSGAVQGGPRSFADICERVSDFLATFSNPVDRTRRSYEVAVSLARIISEDTNSSSNALQIQLESDLVNMVARKAAAKEGVERRVERVEGYGSQNKTTTMKRMLEGGLSASALDTSQLARNATNDKGSSDKVFWSKQAKAPFPSKRSGTSRSSADFQKGSRSRLKRQTSRREPLTPHFAGIDIMQSSDSAWLDIPHDKSRRELHDLTFGATQYNKNKRENLVFFNSNDFHGDQFLTEEATNAGYTKGQITKDATMLERGIGVLISEDQENKAKLAEERLLRNLVQYLPSRSAMSAAVSTSDATGASPEIDWSTEERSWLFRLLVFRSSDIPEEITEAEDPETLWKFLSNRADAPVGAFGTNPFGCAVTATFVTNPSPTSGMAGDVRLRAVDAKIVQPPELQDESRSTRISSDYQDIEDWSASYDPSMFDDIEIPRDEATILELQSMDASERDVIDTETVIDAKLLTKNPVDKEQTEEPPTDGESQGTLDKFFVEYEDVFATTYDESVQRSYRAELEVQEALAYLLRASAAKKLSNVNSNWLLASRSMDARLGVEGDDADVMSGYEELDSMNIGDLQLYCQSLVTRLQQLHHTVHQLDASAKRISTRLMEYSQGDSTEGKISVAKQEQVCNEMEVFLSELPEDYEPGEIDNLMDPMYVLSLYEQPGEEKKDGESPPMQEEYNKDAEEYQFRRDMEYMDESWEGMGEDDYNWSMPDGNEVSGRALSVYSGQGSEDSEDELEEPLEEALSRIDDEWGDWDIDSSNDRTSAGSIDDMVQDPYDEGQGDPDEYRMEDSGDEASDGQSFLQLNSESEWE